MINLGVDLKCQESNIVVGVGVAKGNELKTVTLEKTVNVHLSIIYKLDCTKALDL